MADRPAPPSDTDVRIVGGEGIMPERRTAARWRRSATVQPPAQGNYRGAPGVRRFLGLVPGPLPRAPETYSQDATIRAAHVSSQGAAPYAGRVYPNRRSDDDGSPPAFSEEV